MTEEEEWEDLEVIDDGCDDLLLQEELPPPPPQLLEEQHLERHVVQAYDISLDDPLDGSPGVGSAVAGGRRRREFIFLSTNHQNNCPRGAAKLYATLNSVSVTYAGRKHIEKYLFI